MKSGTNYQHLKTLLEVVNSFEIKLDKTGQNRIGYNWTGQDKIGLGRLI